MTEVRIEVIEPYKVYFYQMKYTFIVFSLFLIIFELMAFITDYTSPYDMKNWIYIVAFVFACFVTSIQAFPFSLYHSFRACFDRKRFLEVHDSFKIIKAYSNHEPNDFNYNSLYTDTYKSDIQRMHIEFSSTNSEKITLYSDTQLIDMVLDYCPNTEENRVLPFDKKLNSLIFKKIVYGACSKIIFECVFEYDETLIKN